MPFGVSEKFSRTSSCQLRLADLARAEGIHQHADRLSHADRIRKLHFAAVRQARRHDVLRDVARHVRRRAVHLRRVLAAERAAAMPAHAAIGVDDDLASGQPGVAHRPADHEPSRRIDVVLRVLHPAASPESQPGSRSSECRARSSSLPTLLRMLRRDHDRIHAHRLVVRVVLHRHLALAVGPQIGHHAVLANFGQLDAPACAPARSASASAPASRWSHSRTSCPGRRRRPCPRPCAMSADCLLIVEITAQVFESKPYSASS